MSDADHAPSRRRKVLLVTDEMEVGGTQRQIVHLAGGLDRSRFAPAVLYFRNPSPLVDELGAAGVPVHRIDKRGAIDLVFLWRLRAWLAAHQVDVVHGFAFSAELWSTVARRLLPRSQRPLLITSVRGTYEWYRPWQWRAKRWVGSQSGHVVANSRMGARYAEQHTGRPEGSIEVIYNGVECSRPDPARAAALRAVLAPGPRAVLALFVGRLVDHKDLPTLLRATALARTSVPGLRLAIAGDGPLRASVEAQRDALHLQAQVTLLGERRDVADLVEAADLLVLPSLREGLSNVILEAMAGGRAVIASRAGGNVELVEPGRTGMLFDVGDAAGLAAAMARLAGDEPLRRQLGEQGRAKARTQFATAAMVRAYERLYAATTETASAWRAALN